MGLTLVEKPAASDAFLLGNTVAGSCSDDDDCNTDRGFRCVQGGTCKEVAWTRVTPDEVGTFVVRLRATFPMSRYFAAFDTARRLLAGTTSNTSAVAIWSQCHAASSQSRIVGC